MTIIEDLSKNSFMDLLHYLNSTRMQYRKSLNLPSSVTFGNEIEVNDIILDDAREIVEDFNMRKKLWGRDHFIVHKDLTCDSEIVTPIMTDKPKYWSLLWDMYMCLDEHGATYSDNTSSHIHMGTSLFDTPEKLSLLLKTLVVFEPIIFKFGYGRDDEPREFITYRPHTGNYSMFMSPKRVRDFVSYLDSKKLGGLEELDTKVREFLNVDLRIRNDFNFRPFDFRKFLFPVLGDGENDHMEFRNFNSADPIVVQNNIDLCGHLFLAVATGRIDKEYVLSEYEKYKKKRYNFDYFCATLDSQTTGPQYNRLLNGFNKVKIDKACKLADMIFNDDLSKYHFLKQYLKLYSRNEEYVSSLCK